ncbi:hypothetical protein [Pelobacter seleniigenes]|uniref:hypothetical protein n=1 Tax=Pelobacter seleniigenes TaxID=407188 RepID=UPI0004A78334|nr:hypothetical protein [Pelobacter seleniigenes]
MSQNFSSALPSINHTDQLCPSRHSDKNARKAHQATHHRPIEQLDRTTRVNDRTSVKAFASLAGSLQRAFADAVNVDQESGTEEIKQGGLRRIGKDLQKLFKGMGFSPHLAKQYAGKICQAMGQNDLAQLDVSLSLTRTVDIQATSQTTYSATGQSMTEQLSATESLQLSAVQVRSFDLSLNLTTGEFSIQHSSSDSLSISAAQSTTSSVPMETGPNLPQSETAAPVDSEEPATEQLPEPETTAPTEPTAADQLDAGATVQVESNSLLLQLSRTITQSALLKTQPVEPVANDQDQETNPEDQAVARLEDFIQLQFNATETVTGLFESMTTISNLRVENQDNQPYLRFTAAAVAPVGLTVIAESGDSTTVYPQEDGHIASFSDTPVEVSA